MAYRSSTIATGNSTAPTVTVPTGAAINDIALLKLSSDANTADTLTLPTGFTLLDRTNMTFDGQIVAVAWKRLSAADTGSYACSTGGAAAAWALECELFSGRDTTNPPVISTADVSNTGHTGTVSISANGVTAVSGDDLSWFGAADQSTAGTHSWTAPSGYTLRQSVTASSLTGVGCATQDGVAAGATGTVTGTDVAGASEGWTGYLVRIPSSSSGSSFSGSPATVATAAPSGTETVTVAGSPAAITVAAPAGTWSAGGMFNGSPATAAVAAPTGTITVTIAGTPATITVAVPNIGIEIDLGGSPAAIATAAPAGTWVAGNGVSGNPALSAVAALAGTLAVTFAGQPAQVTLTAPAGSAGVPLGVVPLTITLLGQPPTYPQFDGVMTLAAAQYVLGPNAVPNPLVPGKYQVLLVTLEPPAGPTVIGTLTIV